MKDEYDFKRARRGAVLSTGKGKTRITIRIDDDVLDWFRASVHEAGGGSYQTSMNEALRKHIERENEPIEDTFRRVLREELPARRTGKLVRQQGTRHTATSRKTKSRAKARPTKAGKKRKKAAKRKRA